MIMPWSFVLENPTNKNKNNAEKKVTYHMSTTTSKAFVPLEVE
jgi:hypothetical protein